MVENMAASLIYLGNETGQYIPNLGIYTLTQWDSHSGYIIKTTEPSVLRVDGVPENDFTLQLESGWNFIPVLSSVNVNAVNLFNSLGSSFEVAVLSVYWPEFQITTLSVLQPGKSYFVRVNQPCSLHFQSGK